MIIDDVDVDVSLYGERSSLTCQDIIHEPFLFGGRCQPPPPPPPPPQQRPGADSCLCPGLGRLSSAWQAAGGSSMRRRKFNYSRCCPLCKQDKSQWCGQLRLKTALSACRRPRLQPSFASPPWMIFIHPASARTRRWKENQRSGGKTRLMASDLNVWNKSAAVKTGNRTETLQRDGIIKGGSGLNEITSGLMHPAATRQMHIQAREAVCTFYSCFFLLLFDREKLTLVTDIKARLEMSCDHLM